MNPESLTNVLTRQWRIVTGSKTVNPRNRMPERGASGSVGAPLTNLRALPGTRFARPSALIPFFSGTSLRRCAVGLLGLCKAKSLLRWVLVGQLAEQSIEADEQFAHHCRQSHFLEFAGFKQALVKVLQHRIVTAGA